MRSAALVACLALLALAAGAFVFAFCSGDVDVLPGLVPPTPSAAQAPVPPTAAAAGRMAREPAAVMSAGADAGPPLRIEVPLVAPEPVDERPGSLLVLARHQRDGRPAAGVNLRVVSLATDEASLGPTVSMSKSTRFIGSDFGTPRRFSTGIALGRARVEPDGSALFASLPTGTHVLRDDRSGVDVSVRITPGATTAIEFTIPQGVRVEGTVVRPDGAPVAGALVEAWQPNGEVEIETLATTDWAGRFAIDDVRPGCHFGVRAEEHFASEEHSVDNQPLQRVRVELKPDACSLDGFVVTGWQQPIADAVVQVGFLGYGPRGLWTRTDARGHFRLFGLDCDEHAVVVNAVGYSERRTRAVVETPTQFVLDPKPQ